jgi:hypothetical protein
MSTFVDVEIKEKLVTELRSGKYEQGSGCLRDRNGRFCCLGVLCDIVDKNNWITRNDGIYFTYQNSTDNSYLPEQLSIKLFGHTNAGNCLAKMNDDGETFLEIADYIETNM